jgi:hypothetical protein
MSTDRDTTRIVRSWLRTDENESADRVLDAVLDALDTTPQRRATWWTAWRTLFVNTTMRFGIAAAALLALVFLGLQLLPGGGIGGPITTDEANPSPTGVATSTATATEGAWVPFGALEEGRNELVLNDVRFSIEVGAGWQRTQFEGMIRRTTPSNGHFPWIGLLNRFDSVADDPCAASAIPVGPTVDDVANGLTTIPGTEASEPSDTTLGGVAAKFVELTINDDIGCPPNEFWLYGRDSAYPNSTDSTIRVWVFELDATRYVIHSDQVGEDPEVGAMIVDVVESIEFEPSP